MMASINPLIHYFSSGINEKGRFANATFKAFESGEAWAISPDLSGEDFNEFKSATKDLAKEAGGGGLAVWVRFYVDDLKD